MPAHLRLVEILQGYENLVAGNVDQALASMTGGITERMDLDTPEAKQQISNGSVWKMLLNNKACGFLMGCGTPSGSDSEANSSPLGIIQGTPIKAINMRSKWRLKLCLL